MFLKSTKFFLLASSGLLVFLTVFLFLPNSTLAIKLNIPIGGTTEVSDLGEYLATFYKYFIGIIGILATVMIMFGGFRWITAAGSPERIKEAKSNIWSAAIAVVLMLCSYLILNLINPALVQLQLTTGVTPITDIKDMCADKTPCNTRDVKNNCIGKWCPDKGSLPQTCILKDEKSKLYECGDAKEVKEAKKACESFNPSGDEKKCDDYSDLTQGKVCRAANLAAESCQFKDLLQCDEKTEYRVNCKEGGKDCWNEGVGPKFCASTARLCADKDDIKNPAKGIDGICCRKKGPQPDYKCKWN